MKKLVTYLTTVDNPWNPFSNWDEWLAYDIEKGYCTCERLGRIALVSDVLPDTINDQAIDDAMNQLIKTGAFDKNGNYVDYTKVSSYVK